MTEQKLKRSYRFALISSFYITAVLSLLFLGIEYFLHSIHWEVIFLFTVICFGASFLLIQLRIEKLIYKKIKDVYDSVSLLDSKSLRKERITTDMATLTREVEKFAEDKKIEIESLTVRENIEKSLWVIFLTNLKHLYLPFKAISLRC
jgi:two-component system phosphate regulon sensor histidine kinase PhoR